MNLKKLDTIKTPESWKKELLNQEINMSSEENNGKFIKIRKMKWAAVSLVMVVVCATGITVGASTSDSFREFLQGVFGIKKVQEVKLETTKNSEKTKECKTPEGEIKLSDNMEVVGRNETFILEYSKDDSENVKNVYVHIFTDGRDVSPTSGIKYIEALEKKMKSLKLGKIASISGRYYGMDRDNRFDRVKKSYDVMTKPSLVVDVKKVWKSSQKNKITDEFIVPTATIENGFIEDNDGIIFFNFRPDRLRELASAFTNDKYECFDRCKINNLKVVSMMHVTDTVLCPYAFELPKIKNTLGEYISKKGFTQLRIAETEKYAHVTYFFDGGIDKVYDNEKRILIPSPKVATYDREPEMSANMITASLVKEITSNKEDLVVLNFANGDMVGHTGDYDAAIKAVETVDECIGKILKNISLDEYTMIIIADHGNCEVMRNKDGSINTSHTTNLVPFIVLDKKVKLLDGKLGDVAPTILYLMGIDIPSEMTGNILIKNRKKK